MLYMNRRNFIKTVSATIALPAFARKSFGADELKVGFAYLGPVGDFGWTWAHDKGRKFMVDQLGGKVIGDYVENVAEDASAVPVIRDLAQSGHNLIFTTSFGYMDQTLKAASEFPNVKFEHCTGFKRAENVATYNSRFHEGRAVLGTIAGMMTKTGTLGYLGSFKVPEVVMGVNSFALAAQAVNPNVKVKLVMIDSWFDPAKEAAATETLANLGCDVITAHTDSPATLQVCEQKGLYGFGQGADMSKFAPTAHLTAIEDIWGPYYLARANAMLDGSWKSGDTWWGFKEGTVVISPYNASMPKEVAAAADKIQAGWKDGSYNVFTGPLVDQAGKERLAKGVVMADGDLATIDWFVKGVEGA
jgi:basic membrane protein A and related proteins